MRSPFLSEMKVEFEENRVSLDKARDDHSMATFTVIFSASMLRWKEVAQMKPVLFWGLLFL